VIGLSGVKQFSVSKPVIERTMEFLRIQGRSCLEGLVLWVGTVSDETAAIREAVVPRQSPIRSQFGLSVHVGAETLHELNVWLHQNKFRLLCQVHSHGEHAYHSELDDEHSVVTTIGALSIVVPHFAVRPFSFESSAVLRLTSERWVRLDATVASKLLEVC
jgi:hypothetical protein